MLFNTEVNLKYQLTFPFKSSYASKLYLKMVVVLYGVILIGFHYKQKSYRAKNTRLNIFWYSFINRHRLTEETQLLNF